MSSSDSGDRPEGSVVRPGSRMRIRGSGGVEEEIVLVGSDDEMGMDRLSTRTRLGRTLLGHHAGDQVEVRTEAGSVTFTIVSVES